VARPAPGLPEHLPGTRKEVALGKALRAAIGDFDGDGKNEIVVADAERLRVVTVDGKELASMPAPGGINVLVAAGGEIYAGWGVSRDHKSAPAKIASYKLHDGKLEETVILAPDSERAEVVAIVPGEHDVLVAYYASKYTVKSLYAKRGASGWETTPIAEIRMATAYARGDVDGDGTPDLVVGRVYGDAQGADGDAFVLAPDGVRTHIPTTRGVRSLAIAGGAIFLGDGWHQNYAQTARGLVTVAHHTAGGYSSALVEDTAGQFAIDRIVPMSNGAVVTLGNQYVRVFTLSNGTWQGQTIDGVSRDIAVGDLDGQPGDEILVVGDRSEVIHL
jgi:hypothetical protein